MVKKDKMEEGKTFRRQRHQQLLEPILTSTKREALFTSKKAHIKKFQKLKEQQQTQDRTTSTKVTPGRPSSPIPTQTPQDRVSLFDDHDVPPAALSALAKGPKFVITPRFSTKTLQHTIQVEVGALAYNMRWHQTMAQSIQPAPGSASFLQKLCPFHNQRKEPPRDNKELEKTIKNFQIDLERLIQKQKLSQPTCNLSIPEKQSLISLRSARDTLITRSDKGGEMVVMKASHMRDLCMEHLNDPSTYTKLAKDPTNNIRLKVNKAMDRILNRCDFPRALIYHLQSPTSIRTQRFYALPKTHKATLKIRPIVSGCGGVFDRLGWFLQYLLKPLLTHVSAHLSYTKDLIDKFNNVDKTVLKNMIPASFDVVSLYTNIDTNDAITTTLEYVVEHNLYLYGLETHDLHELLDLILNNNVFTYEDQGTFKQIRGLAMGNRLSGTLAIICMDRFERTHIYPVLQPTVYGRYVDDIGTVVRDTPEAYKTLDHMNEQHATIKFEMELPNQEGFLPILDTQIKIDENGSIERRLFTKAANKGITLHYQSHHPTSTKRAMVSSELQRAVSCSTDRYTEEALTKTRAKLHNNGYPCHMLNQPKKHRSKKSSAAECDTVFTFKIPFINDQLNHKIKHLLRKHNIPARLTNQRGQTIQELVQPKRKTLSTCRSTACPAPKICHRSNVVYLATCSLCNDTYIGMTTRQLHDRAREHIYAAKKRSKSSAFGEHYHQHHSKATPQIEFQILTHARDVLRLHIEEALAIQNRKPTLNRRQEDLGTGFLPSS